MSLSRVPPVPTWDADHEKRAMSEEPIRFIYSHLHDRIRHELTSLSALCGGLRGSDLTPEQERETLAELHGRYRFLRNVYHYHTAVEDEVVYPELESKVRNVTFGYMVEHEDEERLFDELATLLAGALDAPAGAAREGAVRAFLLKAEQIHTTVGKHLAKEEEQLLPLLLQHFSPRAQARLVADFLACIPLNAAPAVLSWLTRGADAADLEGIREALAQLPGTELSAPTKEVLHAWLGDGGAGEVAGSQPAAESAAAGRGGAGGADGDGAGETSQGGQGGEEEEREGGRSAMEAVVHVHDVIRELLMALSADAHALQRAAGGAGATGPGLVALLESLVDKFRVLRQIHLYHCQSEDDAVLPALRAAGVAVGAAGCQADHDRHSEALDDVGQRMRDALMHVRRGTRHARDKVAGACSAALALCGSIFDHMMVEEEQVLPELRRCLGPREQRRLAWMTLRAMPLRLLERVLPWLGARLSPEGAERFIRVLRQAMAPTEEPLVAMLAAWIDQGRAWRQAHPGQDVTSAEAAAALGLWPAGPPADPAEDPKHVSEHRQALVTSPGTSPPSPDAGAGIGADTDAARHRRKRPRHSPTADAPSCAPPSHGAPLSPTLPAPSAPSASSPPDLGLAPIDHIFQFHEALRSELALLEEDAMLLDGTESTLRRLDGRFQFLWSIYHAHSHAEDQVVFPALEGKEALHNVSKSYEMDHREEEVLFRQADAAIRELRSTPPGARRDELVSYLQRVCASIHAAVETHVRSEEEGLWPLFVEHFSRDEQQALVGTIIGRTGAEVLQAMLPWVQMALPAEEVDGMIDSLKEVAKNTRFDRWLDAVMDGRRGVHRASHSMEGRGGASDQEGPSGVGVAGAGDGEGEGRERVRDVGGAGAGAGDGGEMERLRDVADYLRGGTSGGVGGVGGVESGGQGGGGGGGGGGVRRGVARQVARGEVAGVVEDRRAFQPGWEDLFRMTQQQLEAAVRRMTKDPELDEQRRAYLMQNLMAARYIVAQQVRMRGSPFHAHVSAPSAPGTPSAGAGSSVGASRDDRTTLGVSPSPESGLGGAGVRGWGAEGGRGCEGCDKGGGVGGDRAEGAGPGPGSEAVTWHDREGGVLGCAHYARGAQLVAPCCGRVYTCRQCHDEAEDHVMDRYAVREMRCMRCGVAGSVGPQCSSCNVPVSRYYCDICHLLDDTPGRDIYHCPFCNVCRRGKGLGVDFFHCMRCNSCMSMGLFRRHKCRENALESDCPVCHEHLFESAQPVKELPCGHFLHLSCFGDLTRHSYQCPLCKKSVGDMAMYFRMIDAILAQERLAMPHSFRAQTQSIHCNDCGADGTAPFHFVYHKCPACHSYNTSLV